uniref:Uncharacterized protein n=1 Tax=Ditylenchus dipsaci TaxID=166011 RepID=A0A915DKK8_9BILA
MEEESSSISSSGSTSAVLQRLTEQNRAMLSRAEDLLKTMSESMSEYFSIKSFRFVNEIDSFVAWIEREIESLDCEITELESINFSSEEIIDFGHVEKMDKGCERVSKLKAELDSLNAQAEAVKTKLISQQISVMATTVRDQKSLSAFTATSTSHLSLPSVMLNGSEIVAEDLITAIENLHLTKEDVKTAIEVLG